MISFVFFILVFAVFLCFIVFNLGNASDVSLGFRTFNDIPVYVTALFSYALGMLFVLPLIFSMGHRRRRKPRVERAAKVEDEAEHPQIEGTQTEILHVPDQQAEKLPPPKKKLFGRMSSKKTDLASEEDKTRKENNPYGID